MDLEKIKENWYKLNKDQVLVKGKKKYRIVYPIKTDGKINWKNLLVGQNIWGLVFIAIILFATYGYIHDTAECREILANPKKICGTGVDIFGTELDEHGFNLSGLEDEFNISLPA